MMCQLPLLFSFSFSGASKGQMIVYLGMALFFIFFYVFYKKQAVLEEKRAEDRRSEYIASSGGLSDEVRNAIEQGRILKDMSEEEVIASLGIPRRRKILTEEPAKSEVLIYPGLYIHMHMGVVRNWEQHKKLLGL